jgi:DNA-binding CsgD family transcriptional regulator
MKTERLLERLACVRRQETTPATMNLITRQGSAQDLARCKVLHASLRLPYPEGCSRALVEMWRALLSNWAMQISLVEDRAKPLASRIVSFSATVFATDEFCCEARSTLAPYLGVQVARRFLSHKLPLLNRKQVARANARRGLNAIMCFGGCEADGLSSDQILAVREKQSEAFRLDLSGYRIKEFLADTIGEEAAQWMLDSGAHLRRDYSRYFEKRDSPTPEASQRPWLVGLTKTEALANPGSYLSSFFVYAPPRFHFSHSEQLLLQHALVGETSDELANSLFISPWTVKKRWHAIYERVANVDRELLPPVANGLHVASRGAEHRRHLLYYLRQHLEELRPWSQ